MEVIEDDTVRVIGTHQVWGWHETMIDHAILSAGDQVRDQVLDEVLSQVFRKLRPVLEEIRRLLDLVPHLGDIVESNKTLRIVQM
jgi:hypothetical protein